MLVFICLPNDSLGGAEQFLQKLAIWHLNYGDRVVIYILKQRNFDGWISLELLDNCRIVYGKAKSEKIGLLFLLSWIAIHRKFNFDRVYSSHVHLNGVLGYLRKLKMLRTRSLVVRESTLIFKRFSGFRLLLFKFLYTIGYRHSDLVICQTEEMKRCLENSSLKVFKGLNIAFIPNPFDFPSEKMLSSPIPDLLKSSPFLVAAGRLIPEKGFDVLVKVFARIHEIYPTYRLVILGDGIEKMKLLELCRKLGVIDFVFFPGNVHNVYPYFLNAHCCIISSIMEGFPNTLLQMMSVNGRVVSTNCADGISSIENLYVANVSSVESLFFNISLCLNNTSISPSIFHDYLRARNTDVFMRKVNLSLSIE